MTAEVTRIFLNSHVNKDRSCTESGGNNFNVEAEFTRRHRALEEITLVVKDDSHVDVIPLSPKTQPSLPLPPRFSHKQPARYVTDSASGYPTSLGKSSFRGRPEGEGLQAELSGPSSELLVSESAALIYGPDRAKLYAVAG